MWHVACAVQFSLLKSDTKCPEWNAGIQVHASFPVWANQPEPFTKLTSQYIEEQPLLKALLIKDPLVWPLA